MVICDLCSLCAQHGGCELGLDTPKRMRCRGFDPGLERFCSDPEDFVSPAQIVGMSTYFGIKGTELKKVKLMAARAADARLSVTEIA